MRADANSEAEIFAVMDGFLDDVKNKRLDETLARFSSDDDCSLFGSDLGDTSIGLPEIRNHFAALYQRPITISFMLKFRRASQNGETAWYMAQVDLQVSSSPKPLPYIMTCVLVRRGGKWLMQLYHGSEPR